MKVRSAVNTMVGMSLQHDLIYMMLEPSIRDAFYLLQEDADTRRIVIEYLLSG